VTAPRLLVLADDLIWSTRLEGQGRTLGAEVQRFATPAPLVAALTAHPATPTDLVAIDATARAYDAEAAVRAALDAGATVTGAVARELGFRELLLKPYDLCSLGEAIHRVLSETTFTRRP